MSGIKHIALTKIDILKNIDPLKLCVGYKIDGKLIETIPADTSLLNRAEPVYETLPGWKEDVSQIRAAADIPQPIIAYLRFIESYTGGKINLLSTGASREQVVDIQRPF